MTRSIPILPLLVALGACSSQAPAGDTTPAPAPAPAPGPEAAPPTTEAPSPAAEATPPAPPASLETECSLAGHIHLRLQRPAGFESTPAQGDEACSIAEGSDPAASDLVMTFTSVSTTDGGPERELRTEPDGAGRWLQRGPFQRHGQAAGDGEVTIAGESVRYYRRTGDLFGRPREAVAARMTRGDRFLVLLGALPVGDAARLEQVLGVWRALAIEIPGQPH